MNPGIKTVQRLELSIDILNPNKGVYLLNLQNTQNQISTFQMWENFLKNKDIVTLKSNYPYMVELMMQKKY